MKAEKGIALIIVLLFLMLILVAIASITFINSSAIRTVNTRTDTAKAFYLAEAGIQYARFQLSQDWTDHSSKTNIPLGEGEYDMNIYEVDTDNDGTMDPDKLRVRSTGKKAAINSDNEFARTIEVILQSDAEAFSGIPGVNAAIEADGDVIIQGNAELDPSEPVTYSDFTFESIFGMTKETLKNIVINNAASNDSVTYYDGAFSNEAVDGITWITATDPQITTNSWTGSGLLVIEGDMKITGGTFNGLLWVDGTLTINGNPEINGGIYVESDFNTDTTDIGTARINQNDDYVAAASDEVKTLLGSILPRIESWEEPTQ